MTLFNSNSRAEITVSASDFDHVFQSASNIITWIIQKFLGKGSGGIIDSVIHHTISISKITPLAGSSYLELPTKLNYPREDLINTQNLDDNICCKLCLVRLHPVDHNLKRITKADKYFAKKFHFEDVKFPVKVRDIHKLKKITPSVLVSFVMKIKRKIQSLSQMFRREKCWSILIGEEGKRHYVLMKDFNTFMYHHTLHHEKKIFFCSYCLQDFSTKEISNRLIKDCFKNNNKQRLVMPKKDEYVQFKSQEKYSPAIIYADFTSNFSQKILGRKIKESLIQANVKNILLL